MSEGKNPHRMGFSSNLYPSDLSSNFLVSKCMCLSSSMFQHFSISFLLSFFFLFSLSFFIFSHHHRHFPPYSLSNYFMSVCVKGEYKMAFKMYQLARTPFETVIPKFTSAGQMAIVIVYLCLELSNPGRKRGLWLCTSRALPNYLWLESVLSRLVTRSDDRNSHLRIGIAASLKATARKRLSDLLLQCYVQQIQYLGQEPANSQVQKESARNLDFEEEEAVVVSLYQEEEENDVCVDLVGRSLGGLGFEGGGELVR